MLNQLIQYFLCQAGYQLVVIEDEEIPLAPGVGMMYFGPVLLIVFIIATVLILGIYTAQCERQRKRIEKLDYEGKAYRGWNLHKLTDTAQDLENQRVSEMSLSFSEC